MSLLKRSSNSWNESIGLNRRSSWRLLHRHPRSKDPSPALPRAPPTAESVGLTVVYEPPPDNTNGLDIVFVHPVQPGSTSSPQWLREFLPRDIPNARVMAYGFDLAASFMFSTLSESTTNKAQNLGVLLEAEFRHERYSNHRPLVFIGHSLGGLVVKEALVLAHKNGGTANIAARTVGVAFFGVPHYGSNFSGWGSLVAALSSRSLVSKSLLPGADMGTSDIEFFEYVRGRAEDKRPLQIVSFFETRPSIVGKGLELIVPQGSTVLPFSQSYPVDADHRRMTEFSHPVNKTYQDLRSFIAELEPGPSDSDPQPQSLPPNRTSFPSIAELAAGGATYREMEDQQRQIMELARLRLGDNNPQTMRERKLLGDVYYCSGLLEEAREVLEQLYIDATSTQPKTIDEELIASIQNSLCLALMDTGSIERARDLALDAQPATWSPEVLIGRMDNVGAIEFQTAARAGKTAASLQSYQKRREAFNRCQSEYGMSDVITILERLALELTALPEPESAEFDVLPAWCGPIPEEVRGQHLEYRLRNMSACASLIRHIKSGDPDHLSHALREADRSTFSLHRILGPDHPDSLLATHNLSIMYALDGRLEAAKYLSARVGRTAVLENPFRGRYIELADYLSQNIGQSEEVQASKDVSPDSSSHERTTPGGQMAVPSSLDKEVLGSLIANWAGLPVWIWGTIRKSQRAQGNQESQG